MKFVAFHLMPYRPLGQTSLIVGGVAQFDV